MESRELDFRLSPVGPRGVAARYSPAAISSSHAKA